MRMLPETSALKALPCEGDVPQDLYRVADLEVTLRRQSVERRLIRCHDTIANLVAAMRKLKTPVYYVSPRRFAFELRSPDGSVVRCHARIRLDSDAMVEFANWLELNVTTPGESVTAESLAALLGGKPKPVWLETDAEEALSACSETLSIGSKLCDRWQLVKVLGEGGMGKTYLARDLMTGLAENALVVVKTMRAEYAHNPREVERFVAEAKILKGLRHAHIAALEDCLMSGTMPVIILEYIEGEPLSQYLANQDGCLDEAAVRELLRPIAAALDYAHGEGIFHLDVKPQNIMVRPEVHAGARTCLLDFGIARWARAEGDAALPLAEAAGTLPYMSQEQRNGEAAASAMDVFALAVTAYECLTGVRPYPRGQSPTCSVMPLRSSTPFARAIMRGLDINPSRRPASCAELIGPSSGAGLDADDQAEERVVAVMRAYRALLADSAAGVEAGNPSLAEWLRNRQVELRELTQDPRALDGSALAAFFAGVADYLQAERLAPEAVFAPYADLCELRLRVENTPELPARDELAASLNDCK